MMHGHEKSRSAIVAVKPMNKAERSAAEHGHEKSRSAIVAVKPANKAERSAAEQSAAEPTAAELVERRAETKGNVDQQSTRRTQRRISVSKMLLARIRQQIVAVDTQGGNRMRESCKYGSVRGARGNSRPLYVADCLANRQIC